MNRSTPDTQHDATAAAVEDVLGAPYHAETIQLAPDDEGEVVATLVRRPAATTTTRAVLHVHGFSDYFFQTAYAEWWNEQGFDFYALDLRKYGRSLRPHQTPAFVTDLAEYDEELDAAWQLITERDGHTSVVVAAHSTGGLVTPLWADRRRPAGLGGMVLNSPWLDLQGSSLVRIVGTPIIKRLGQHKPKFVIGREVDGLYAKSLHRDHDGEFEFNLEWKPLGSMKVHAGWLAAIRNGHARLQRGLDVPAPVLVLSSDRSGFARHMGEVVHTRDIVLSVKQIRRWSPAIGRHVTYAAILGAKHDVFLSRPEARERAYDETRRWLAAYVD